MAIKPRQIKPVDTEAYTLDDPRGPAAAPATEPPAGPSKPMPAAPASKGGTVSALPAKPTRARVPRPSRPSPSAPANDSAAPSGAVNPYARAGRPSPVAVSLYLPQWERGEAQCAELRELGIRDANLTAWLSALLEFNTPKDAIAALRLARDFLRLEADHEANPYAGLRKQARVIRLYEPLWDRQRTAVTALRREPLGARPTLALWVCAVEHYHGPKDTEAARVLLRRWRLLLAADPG